MTFDTTLLGILLATALSGIGSMAGAAVLSLTVLSRMVDRMVSFSVGVLLATSLLHSLPEAFEAHRGIEPNTHALFATLLAGLGLVPPVIWTSLPALVAGLVAVYTGLVGIGETSSKGLGGRGKAMVGIALGTLGMFLPRMLQMLF